MPIKIDFIANIRDFIRGAGDVEEALDDVADSLDDVAKDGEKDTEKLERSFRDLSRQARDTSKDVESIGDRGPGHLRKLGDATEEVSSELKQNLGETFSSFRGDLEDLPQVAQDVLGGLAGSFGTLWASIGLAAGAAGIGLLIQAFQNLAAEEEARNERVAEWAQAYIDAAGQIRDSVASLSAVESIYTDPEKLKKAEDAAKNWGVELSTAVNAMAGDTTALSVVQENLATNTAIVDEAMSKLGYGGVKGLSYEMRTLKDETTQGQTALDMLTAEMSEGEQLAASYAASVYNLAMSTGVATGAVDDLGNKIYALPDGTEVVVDAVTGQAYANLDAIENKTLNLPPGQAKVSVVDQASAGIDRIIAQNTGREIRLTTRVERPGGGRDF